MITPDRFERAGELFEHLRGVSREELSSALDAACDGDSELREQVLMLLEGDRVTGEESFLDKPAYQAPAVADDSGVPEMPLPAVIGRFRLVQRIGAGGMGVVYQAQDLRLTRKVAVKMLPASLSAASDRIERFQLEARAASQLNHPNIVSIYDAGFDLDCYYIAMELVQGRTLRQWLTEDGPLEAEVLLDILSQVASALESAHQAGIVHRDIKPENVMVRKDGIVKVVDFGLARVLHSESDQDYRSLTRPGHLPGTVRYLSPEQVRGKHVGPQSDVFSLGVVAYELATGVRPFDGPTDGAAYDSILHQNPPAPSVVRPELGTAVDGLILGAIEKDPDLRMQTAGELRSACKRLLRQTGSGEIRLAAAGSLPSAPTGAGSEAGAIPAMKARGVRWPAIAATLAVGVLGGAAIVTLRAPAPGPKVTRIAALTSKGDVASFVADSAAIYFEAGKAGPEARMFKQSIRGGDAIPVPQWQGMFPMDLSPDHSELLLGQYSAVSPQPPNALWVTSVLGDNLRRLQDAVCESAKWSPAGDHILCSVGPKLMLLSADGTFARNLLDFSGEIRDVSWSPDGKRLRFTSMEKGLETIWDLGADGSGLRRVFPDWARIWHETGAWTPGGAYYFFSVRQGTSDLWAVPGDTFFRRPKGADAVRVTTGPLEARNPKNGGAENNRILFLGNSGMAQLVKYGGTADTWEPFLGGIDGYQLEFSPDGRSVVYVGSPRGTLWRSNADGSGKRQITSAPMYARNPRWSPDGMQIAFFGGPPGEPLRIYGVPANGGPVRQWTHGEKGPNEEADPSWAPDGTKLLYAAQMRQREHQGVLATVDLRTGKIEQLPNSGGLWSPRWSPDGRSIAALNTRWRLALYDLQTHTVVELTPFTAGFPSWSHDGQSIYCEDTTVSHWYRVGVNDRKIEQLAAYPSLRMAAHSTGWVGLTPRDELISSRDISREDVYEMLWERR